MDPKRIVALVVGASVMVLIFSALLVPIINDATTTEKTFENVGYFDLKEYSGDDIEYSAKWDHTEPTQFTVNDEVIPITYTENVNTSIVLDGNFFLRYFPNTGVTLYYGSQAIVEANTTNGYDMTLSYSEGTLTITNGNASREITVDTFYSIANDGPFVMKKGNVAAYMKEDSIIYGSGRTNVGTDVVGTLVSGTIDDVEVTIWRGEATSRDVVINATEVSGYIDLYSFDNVEFYVDDTKEDNPTTTAKITYSYVVVPAEVTAELAVHPDSATLSMLSVIPIIVMIGIVLAVVGVAIVGRNDY